MFDDLISARQPSNQKRIRGSEGGVEHYLTEGAVMVAFAMHLLRTVPGLKHVAIHPDGQHADAFDFPGWFKKQGFAIIERVGRNSLWRQVSIGAQWTNSPRQTEIRTGRRGGG